MRGVYLLVTSTCGFTLFLLSLTLLSYLAPSSPLLPITNDVTGKPASQAYPVPDKRIIVLSQLGMYVLFISSGESHEMAGCSETLFKLSKVSWGRAAGRSRPCGAAEGVPLTLHDCLLDCPEVIFGWVFWCLHRAAAFPWLYSYLWLLCIEMELSLVSAP